ncbi:MAG: ferredoxin:protochlorophyllide reductase (ATP-dependent) subunit B, partial [Cyanobacteria bacterium J06643_4]
CAVISTPIHVQDVPARYSPQMGWEGANVIFDDWVHPLMMGLEEHLIGMFREDFEFAEGHMSHLHTAPHQEADANADANSEPVNLQVKPSGDAPISANADAKAMGFEPGQSEQAAQSADGIGWSADGLAELKKIPFFVRGKVKRNTEKFASDRGITAITVDTLYEAKAAIGK